MGSAETSKQYSKPVSEQAFPFMAPPMIRDNETGAQVSQLAAVIFYAATKVGMMPSDPHKAALCVKITCDCGDILEGISRGGGHIVMWDKIAWDAFYSTRFVKWLQIFETLGTMHGLKADGGFLLGTESACVADLNVFALFHTMERCLPETKPVLRLHAPCAARHTPCCCAALHISSCVDPMLGTPGSNVMALTDRILASSPPLQDFVKKQAETDGDCYCGGFTEKSIRNMLAGKWDPVIVDNARYGIINQKGTRCCAIL